AKMQQTFRQACDAGFVPFSGSPPCRLQPANGVSPEAIVAVEKLCANLSELPWYLHLNLLKKNFGLSEELRKICTTQAGVVTWFDFARVFTSFDPLVSKRVVSEIWTYMNHWNMAKGEELELQVFLRFCLPGGFALPLVSPLSAEEETKRMARADLEANKEEFVALQAKYR
ncbi:PNO, partial [Symbiodinium sp. CCMP2456]